MTTKLLLGKDLNGNVTYQLPFSDTGQIVTLVASAEQSITVPQNCNCAWFAYTPGATVIVDPENTAALPTGTFASSTADINPVARNVTPGQTLSFICSTIASVKVSFYEQSGTFTGIG